MKRYDMTRGRCGSGNQVKRGHSKIWREILVRDNDMLDTCSDCGASDLVDNGTLDTPGGKVGAFIRRSKKMNTCLRYLGHFKAALYELW